MSHKLYKYWFFYLKVDEFTEPELYAYTDKKELCHNFMIERNMKIFVMKKHKITKEQVNELASDVPELYLELFEGLTKLQTDNMKIVDFCLTATKNEVLTATNTSADVLYSKLWAHTVYNPELFLKSIQKALNALMYTDGYYTMYSNKISKDLAASYLYDSISEDQLGAFIHYYGKTIRNGGKIR